MIVTEIWEDLLEEKDKRIEQLESENSKLEGKLAKAKKLLAFWVDNFNDAFNRTIKYEERHKALVETEQFLKEVDE